MTLEEKLRVIGAYCATADCERDGCPLFETDFSNGGVCFSTHRSESEVNEMYRILFGEVDPDRPDYWANVCEIQKRQTEKGLSKYGQRLEDNESLSPIERLEYLEEELIDGLMYIEHIKAVLRVHEVGVSVPVEDLKKTRDFLDGVIRKAEEVVK